jgi:hypothetical protein
MTISCLCPSCDALCAFHDHNAGRKARCRRCGQIFVIPARDGARPEKVKIKPVEEKPVPGFYRAVFVDSWGVFFRRDSLAAVVFVLSLVVARFLLVRSWWAEIRPELNYFFWADFPLRVAYLVVLFMVEWGWLLGFYLNVIYETAYGIDALPEPSVGSIFSVWWLVLRPLFVFLLTMVLVQLPYIAGKVVLGLWGIRYENIWVIEAGPVMVLQVLFLAGLFLFPMGILTMAVAENVGALRPDWLIGPILKAAGPYLVAVGLLVAAGVLEWRSPPLTSLSGESTVSILGRLAANFGVIIVTIVAMRAIGLFHRHYGCYIRW